MAAKTRFITQCVRHGAESKDWAGKQVVVSQPTTKAQRNTIGYPFCRAEQQKALRESAVAPTP